MKLLSVSIFMLWLASTAFCVEPYPWIPGNQSAPVPVYPEILIEAEDAIEAVAQGELLPMDLRSIEEYGFYHIPGAIWKLTGKPNSSQALLLYADDFETLGSTFLILDGDPTPRILVGGIDAWRAAGGEIEQGGGHYEKEWLTERAEQHYVNVTVVNEAYGHDDFELIDLRGEDVWMRFEEVDNIRAGHIPHSLPYDFGDLFLGRHWPEPAAARTKFMKLGPRENDHVNPAATFILYGDDSVDSRLGLAYLMLRIMDVDVRIYQGGWADWASSADNPIVRILPTDQLESMLRRENPKLSDDTSYASLALLDLRGNLDFSRRHLPGAHSLPIHLFRDSLSTLIDEHWPAADLSKLPLVFYCYGPDCIRSRNGASMAARQGFRDLLWYREGVEGWRRTGLPLHK